MFALCVHVQLVYAQHDAISEMTSDALITHNKQVASIKADSDNRIIEYQREAKNLGDTISAYCKEEAVLEKNQTDDRYLREKIQTVEHDWQELQSVNGDSRAKIGRRGDATMEVFRPTCLSKKSGPSIYFQCLILDEELIFHSQLIKELKTLDEIDHRSQEKVVAALECVQDSFGKRAGPLKREAIDLIYQMWMDYKERRAEKVKILDDASLQMQESPPLFVSPEPDAN